MVKTRIGSSRGKSLTVIFTLLALSNRYPPLCSFLCFFCFCNSVSLLNWCLENAFLAGCFASFFVMYLWVAWVNVSNFAGDLDKWAIPRASNRCCYKWKLGYQCVQLPKGAIPHFLVKCLNFSGRLALCCLGLGKCKKVKEKNKKCRSFWYYIWYFQQQSVKLRNKLSLSPFTGQNNQ